ncbi:MAG: glycosyltransferase family 4 protein [Flavobacteriaceae bacterium]
MKKPQILMVYLLRNSFVRRDIEALKHLGFSVQEWHAPPYKGIGFLVNRIKEMIWGFFQVYRATHVISWFSDYHSFWLLFWARYLGRPSLVIVGGFDAVAAPHLNYGAFLKKNLRQKIIRANYRRAHEIWVVDASLATGCEGALAQKGVQSGLLQWMPELANKIKTVPTGYDPEYWKPAGPKTPKTVLTVGLFTEPRVMERKGIPNFLELARQWPDFQFVIVGDAHGIISQQDCLPENVKIKGLVSEQEVLHYFQKSTYYAQFSAIEGLPNVLCEAMLCGCIPLGNPVFGIPTAIGDTGLLFDPTKIPEKAASLKKQLLALNPQAPRERILANFHQSKRVNSIKSFIQ